MHCNGNILVARFARNKVQPLVREMDEKSEMDKEIIKGMFEQGVCMYGCVCVHVTCSQQCVCIHV